jgi:hypothetical protein
MLKLSASYLGSITLSDYIVFPLMFLMEIGKVPRFKKNM